MSEAGKDVIVVGAGILGLSTARSLLQKDPSLRLLILEKEDDIAVHQTGHNSGVIHSGIYYVPGSLKARLCRDGVARMFQFCDEHDIRYDRCGKLIVATEDEEMPRLEDLHQRGLENGVPGLRRIEAGELSELEPLVSGKAALLSPDTALVDFREVSRKLLQGLRDVGVEIRLGARVKKLRERGSIVEVHTSSGDESAKLLVNCAGLHSDRIARKMRLKTDLKIIPFRGQYYKVRRTERSAVKRMIYPVPDPRFPFLGVHLSATIEGELKAGPNAVLALGREGYKHGGANPRDTLDTVLYRGFWTLARANWRYGLDEYKRLLSKKAFAGALSRLVPSISPDDLTRSGAGIRAQALERDGSLVDNFRILHSRTSIHVLNAPSPGATAALAIGDHVAQLALDSLS